MMRTDYWREVWVPMTRAHYAQGGFYRAVAEVRDERGRIMGQELGAVLTVEEAVNVRGTVRIFFCGENRG